MSRQPWSARPPCISPPDGERKPKRGTSAQCSPLAVIFAVLLLAAAYLAVSAGQSVSAHKAAILAVLHDVAAVALVLAAAGLLAVMTRRIAACEGRHTDVLPGDEPEPVTVPRKPAKAADPAEPGTYTWQIRPADAAAMAADADAFADTETGVVVSEHGDIYELAGPPAEDD